MKVKGIAAIFLLSLLKHFGITMISNSQGRIQGGGGGSWGSWGTPKLHKEGKNAARKTPRFSTQG